MTFPENFIFPGFPDPVGTLCYLVLNILNRFEETNLYLLMVANP